MENIFETLAGIIRPETELIKKSQQLTALLYGSESSIKSYINLRNIKETDIYNYTL